MIKMNRLTTYRSDNQHIKNKHMNKFNSPDNDLKNITSFKVAYLYGIKHESIIEVIENLSCSYEFKCINYKLFEHLSIMPGAVYRKEKYYVITYNGYIRLKENINLIC